MKFIVMVIAAFAAMLSVAVADEWPRKKLRSTTTTAPIPKPPIRDAARPAPAPAQPGVLGRPAERRDAPVAPAQPELPAVAGTNPSTEIAPAENPQAGGGSSDQDAPPAVSEAPGERP
jgi:hypothetical protein